MQQAAAVFSLPYAVSENCSWWSFFEHESESEGEDEYDSLFSEFYSSSSSFSSSSSYSSAVSQYIRHLNPNTILRILLQKDPVVLEFDQMRFQQP